MSSSAADSYVRCVALVEFDIDKGSCVRCKVPNGAISDAWDTYLAEQMLPDGAEKHEQSATAFFINRPGVRRAFRRSARVFEHAPSPVAAVKIASWRPLGPAGALEIRDGCISLPSGPAALPAAEVNLHPFPEVPDEVLAQLPPGAPAEDAVFAMLRHGDTILGVLTHSAGDHADIEAALQAAKSGASPVFADAAPSSPVYSTSSFNRAPMEPDGPLLAAFSVFVTRKDAAVRRGGINKALAVFGPSLAHLAPLQPLLVEALERCCEIRGADADAIESQRRILDRIYEIASAALADAAAAEARTPRMKCHLALYATDNPKAAMFRASLPFVSGAPTVVDLPLHPREADVALLAPPAAGSSLVPLLRRMQGGFMKLLTAAVCGKRVVVVSRQGGSSADLCTAVMTIAVCVAPLIPDFVRARVFPYTSINCMELFLPRQGYVVGTHNPMFENRKEWRDVLWDLDAGTVTADEFASSLLDAGAHCPLDDAAAAAIVQKVDQMAAQRISDAEQHATARAMIHDHLWRLFVVAANPDVAPTEWRAALFEANSARFVAMELSGALIEFRAGLAASAAQLGIAASQLRRGDAVEDFELLQVLQGILRRIRAPSDVDDLLLCMPAALHGLVPLAQLLFHPSLAVRLLAMSLLKTIDERPAGKLAISRLSSFLVLAYEQQKKELPDTSSAFKNE